MKRIVSLLLVIIFITFGSSSCIKIELVELTPSWDAVPSAAPVPEEAPVGQGEHRHFFDSPEGDSIKLVKCAYEGCDEYGRMVLKNDLEEAFSEYVDSKERRGEIMTFCAAYLTELRELDRYDPELHSFDEDSELGKKNAKFSEMHDKLDEYSEFVSDMRGVARFYYYTDMDEYEDLYFDVEKFALTFIRLYGEIEVEIYESCLREYVFRADEGWDAERLDEHIAESRANADDELETLMNEVDRISVEIDRLKDPMSSDRTPDLMTKMVEANNALARHYGYDNYYEYAMKNVYGREYSLEDIEEFFALTKKYFTPLLWKYQDAYYAGGEVSDVGTVTSVLSGSFIDDAVACDAVYSFLKRVEECQGEHPYYDSYYESANGSLCDGRTVFIDSNSGYMTAFTHKIEGLDLPLMCFSQNYLEITTFIHEHGHYYSHITGADDFSYDVDETQSQGAELLYCASLEKYLADRGVTGYEYARTATLYSNIVTLVDCASCGEFEKAVYTGDVSGIYDPEGRLSDGIDSDEYDYLYDCILHGYEIAPGSDRYWRITVPANPCYYISYAVSLIPAFEIFVEAQERGFERGAEAYLSVFSFGDGEDYEALGLSDVEYMCEYAGIGSPFDEASFAALSEALDRY